MRTLGLTLLATLLAVAPVTAQVRADPGVVIGNRIAVRVNVTLADEETPYYPVRGLALLFTGASSDTARGRTDEAGVLTVLLPPGQYTVSSSSAFPWKGVPYAWSVPVRVRADMGAVELNRANARVDHVAGRAPPPRQVASTGDVTASRNGSDARVGERSSVPWLSIEVGGEGGLTKLGAGTGSDAGYGGTGSFVAGVGPVALALGYRYTSIRYGNDLDPGSIRGGTAEVRYHLRPGSAPVRPYLGAVAGVGRWRESESLSDDRSTMRMLGGTVGAQLGLATSVRLHLAATAAGTSMKRGSTTDTGLFAAASLGLTFDIFSPAR